MARDPFRVDRGDGDTRQPGQFDAGSGGDVTDVKGVATWADLASGGSFTELVADGCCSRSWRTWAAATTIVGTGAFSARDRSPSKSYTSMGSRGTAGAVRDRSSC
jgi:hypothetical protein